MDALTLCKSSPRLRTLKNSRGVWGQFRPSIETLESRLLLAVTIGVDATASVHAIDPNIYGVAFASTAQLNDLNTPLNRNGGNASDTYNMVQDATNHASDWYFESISSG